MEFGVCGIRNRRLIWGEFFFWLSDLKLGQEMKNLTFEDQQMLLMVIWLVLREIEAKEIAY